uniref:Cadherin-like receptor n=1 Tax=Spodoptera litura TaxID=69820 RepID=R4I3I6_SPOLT|nr:cadherin-like receptor [Spodoptera litura]
MALDVRLLIATLLILTTAATAQQDRCGYMVLIPRPERPDFPPQNFDGLTWAQWPLLPAEDREDVCINDYTPDPFSTNHGYQKIYMEEEIVDDVAIAKLNYRGNGRPQIQTPFIMGAAHMLGAEIRRYPDENGDWHLVITQRQDYETPGMQGYIFNVGVEGESLVVMVTLDIVNIDDNTPIIEMLEPCSIPELGEPGITECKYVVTDADGEISTSVMRFEIDSERGDELVFELTRENIPGDWFSVYMVLEVKQPLNYVENPLHIFRVTALDSLPNPRTVVMMVEVENVEHRNPQWITIFAVQQFDEKLERSFPVRAIDGDTGINKPIFYRIETEERDKEFFSIETLGEGRDSAMFHVAAIDRDTLKRDMFNVTIIAYKYGDIPVSSSEQGQAVHDDEGDSDEGGPRLFETPTNVMIIINDINDQRPEPFQKEYTISIMEETAMTLPLTNKQTIFGFHDRDIGPHAQYKVHLESIHPEGIHNAFYIAPEEGYQGQEFIIGTVDHHMLDYDRGYDPTKGIKLKAVAIDKDNNDHIGEAIININLINWNDELPGFDRDSYNADFKETVEADFRIGTYQATDDDIGDIVEHTILGNAANFLRIDLITGDVYVTVNDAFDYHRQNEIFVQIQAVDTLGLPQNRATTQLVIHLEDVNNTPPTLRLPRQSPSVKENVKDGFLITEGLTATDPDTTADLYFEIDWSASYATKQGRNAPPTSEYHGCVEILTVYPDPNNRGLAEGHLVAREVREGVTIDYEEFEVLYLVVRVIDLNTAIGDDYDEAMMTVTIIDMNDNRPLWVAGTLTQPLRVREMADEGVIIGTLQATDIDGPLYNRVRYTMIPINDTPEELVKIDYVTGQLTVNKGQAIDADIPPRFHLYYKITASDKCSLDEFFTVCPPDPTFWNTDGEIAIEITDTNNKVPHAETDQFPKEVRIYENESNGTVITTIIASDLDRDYPNNELTYRINYAFNNRLENFFAVDPNTGVLRVHFATEEVLDRDGDEPEHRIIFTIVDNLEGAGDGNQNSISTEVLVILLDINDNAPELPASVGEFWTVSEGVVEGYHIPPEIHAHDRDEPFSNNSRVGYEILSVTLINREIELPQDPFKIETISNFETWRFVGELVTTMDLRGYWGTYEVEIRAFDHGEPPLYSIETYELTVRPYNFHSPVFVFPTPGSTIRLSRERVIVNGMLALANIASGEFLDRLSATDEDGLEAGRVTFSIVGNDEAEEYFNVLNDGDNSALLTLKQALPDGVQQFELVIRATDGGTEPAPRTTDCPVAVLFVLTQGEPVFSENSATVRFVEKEAGMLERFELPQAEDPKNYRCTEDCHTVYYTIIDGNNGDYFAVEPETNVIYLAKELDRSEREQHSIVIAAANTIGVTTAMPSSQLTVTIDVRDANPRPIFGRELYTAGILHTDNVHRDLIYLTATHTEGLPITYPIDLETMQVDESLQIVMEDAFNINSETGVISLNFQPTPAMHGHFDFEVVASDANEVSDRAKVIIYMISTRVRVAFLFENTEAEVNARRDFIAHTFSNVFDMTCNIDSVLPATDANGVVREGYTELQAHFIRDGMPVPAEFIEELFSDVNVLRNISDALSNQSLTLVDVPGGTMVLPGGDYALAVYILAGIAAFLAVVCLALVIAFFIRNRTLNRRIEALSTKYDTMDTEPTHTTVEGLGLNKYATAPNPFSIEPNIKAPNFDTISEASDDLIGIEDMEQFGDDYFPPENEIANPAFARNPIATHGNTFGLNSTPFNPEVVNSQFKS